MRLSTVAAALVGLSLVGPPVSADDKEKLQGTWKLESISWAEQDSKRSIYLSSESYLVVKGDEIVDRDKEDGKFKEAKSTLKLDPDKKPSVYERKALDGPNKGKTSSGIYIIDGDKLKICSMGKGLPKDFEIVQGQDVKSKYLYEYKRVKK